MLCLSGFELYSRCVPLKMDNTIIIIHLALFETAFVLIALKKIPSYSWQEFLKL